MIAASQIDAAVEQRMSSWSCLRGEITIETAETDQILPAAEHTNPTIASSVLHIGELRRPRRVA